MKILLMHFLEIREILIVIGLLFLIMESIKVRKLLAFQMKMYFSKLNSSNKLNKEKLVLNCILNLPKIYNNNKAYSKYNRFLFKISI
jgi:hypothetical protein